MNGKQSNASSAAPFSRQMRDSDDDDDDLDEPNPVSKAELDKNEQMLLMKVKLEQGGVEATHSGGNLTS